MNSLSRVAILTSLLISPIAYSQVSDPIPEKIRPGNLTLLMEEWVQLPASSGGGNGRARISVMRSLPDGRLFVNDLRGKIHRILEGSAPEYFDIGDEVPGFLTSPGLGTGMHSFAFSPDFLSDGKMYTVHSEAWNSGTPDLKGPTVPVNSAGQISVISEWTTNNPDSNTFNGTRRELMRVFFPGTIHCAQEISFNPNATPGDPDYGILYILLGEGNSFLSGNWENEQRLDSPMGTVLRIDPDGNDSANGQYGIPTDNPWASASDPSIIKELYAYGFRNPHRISWDTGGTNRVYVGDIGEKQLEEVNLLEPGLNYGFPQREGYYLLDATDPANSEDIFPLPDNDDTFGFTYPVTQYDHDEGRAIALGPIYRGALAPDLQGKLFFGDIVNGRIFIVEEGDLVQNVHLQPEEVSLSQNGIVGSLPSFVGSSRADVRFGTDHLGELYIMTKTDGMIRKVIGARDGDSDFDNDPERWVAQYDFEQDTILSEVNAPVGVNRITDPFGDGGNHVVSLEALEADLLLPVERFPFLATGSMYFRFALGASEANTAFQLSRSTSPLRFATVMGNIEGNGELNVFDDRDPRRLTSSLRPGIWYEAWIVFTPINENYAFNFYIEGDQWSAPSLLAAGLLPPDPLGVETGIQTFVFGVVDPGVEEPSLYIDDIYIDPDAPNISRPIEEPWALISDFESANPLDIWTIADISSGNIVEENPPTSSLVEEENGNVALSFSSTTDPSRNSHALVPLPHEIIVSDVATIYGRAKVQSFETNQTFGLVNVPEQDIFGDSFNAYETIGRWTNELNGNTLHIRDGGDYIQAGGTYGESQWTEFWFVVRNGGKASGGQTFGVYTRPNNSDANPAMVYENADFRVSRETSIDFFQLIANNGDNGKTGPILYDDFYYRDGVHLERPEGIGYGLYPGKRGMKYIPSIGVIWDNDYPWIYHEVMEWLYVDSNSPEGAWHYHMELGWLWIAPVTYPYVYQDSIGDWIYIN